MSFLWSQNQKNLRNNAVKFAQTNLNEDLARRDKNSIFSASGWEKCADFGIQGMFVPKCWGGLGLDFISAMAVMDGLGYGCKDSGLLFSINAHLWGAVMPILSFGNRLQKKKYLPGLAKGKLIGAYAATEPQAGSDIFALRTTASKNKKGYTLNGTKVFITNAPLADLVLVFARMAPKDKEKISCFIVEKGKFGFRSGEQIEKMGLKTSPLAEVIFENCIIPAANLLGKEGMGRMIFNVAMEQERAFIMATQVGMMKRQLKDCLGYIKIRKQFGKPIGQFQAISSLIADMKVRLETSDLLLRKLAWLNKHKKNIYLDSSIAKLHISESCLKNSLSALRIFGGYGYTTEYEVERQLRDVLGGLFYSGTSQMQRVIISGLLDPKNDDQ